MSLSPWVQGATLPAMTPTISQIDDNNNLTPLNLTGYTLSLMIRNYNGTETAGIGTWQILDGPNGKAAYFWNAADVAIPGKYALIISINTGSGIMKCQPMPFQILQG